MRLKAAVLAFAAAIGVVVGGAVWMSATSTGAQEAGDAPSGSEQGTPFLDRVAAKLGVEPSVLQQAIRDAGLDALDEAVAAGRIGDERAAKIRERIENGDDFGLGGLRKLRQEHRQRLAHVRGAIVESAAAAIGVTSDELRTQLKAGSSIADAAAAEGVSIDDVKAALTADASARAADAVAAGKIDQARADALLAKFAERLDDIVNKKRGTPAQ